jgi:hypothetical protein
MRKPIIIKPRNSIGCWGLADYSGFATEDSCFAWLP